MSHAERRWGEGRRRQHTSARQGPLPLTDAGDAARFARLHVERARYVWIGSESGTWHLYDGRRWAPDADGAIWRLARDVIGEVLREARRTVAVQEQRALFGHARALQSRARLAAMLDLARSEPGLAVRASAFDAAPWALNFENGTLDLRTGKLRPHRREDLITQLAPLAYDPDASCPRFENFLARIQPEAEVRAFLQRALGAALAAKNLDQVLFLLIGTGMNGKTTLFDTLRHVLGDYAAHVDATTLLSGNDTAGPRPDLTRLRGVRLLFVSEIGAGRHLDEALIKNLTGSDPLVARTLYHEPVEFVPAFIPFLFANHAPVIRDASHGMWRRVRLVPFGVVISEDERDRHLADALAEEAPGIFDWLVHGYRAWQRDGLQEPPEVFTATQGYREDQDALAPFLAERCGVDPKAEVSAARLYREYDAWARDAGERKPFSRRTLGILLRERGFAPEHHHAERVWRGIGLLGEVRTESLSFAAPYVLPTDNGHRDLIEEDVP